MSTARASPCVPEEVFYEKVCVMTTVIFESGYM